MEETSDTPDYTSAAQKFFFARKKSHSNFRQETRDLMRELQITNSQHAPLTMTNKMNEVVSQYCGLAMPSILGMFVVIVRRNLNLAYDLTHGLHDFHWIPAKCSFARQHDAIDVI